MEIIENEIENFIRAFCPFGYLDIRQAVKEAVDAGFDGDWASEQVERFCDECGTRPSDSDPCWIVMDSILQEARNEIGELTGFDVQNDADFSVYGNFMCSSYQSSEQDRDNLSAALQPFKDGLNGLSKVTRYWLEENEVVL